MHEIKSGPVREGKIERLGHELSRSTQKPIPNLPTCSTCPYWEHESQDIGVCHGGPPMPDVNGGGGLNLIRSMSDYWCRLHPDYRMRIERR